MFINLAMNPIRYASLQNLFVTKRQQLNTVIAFFGITVGEDGRTRRATKANNLAEAKARASSLHNALALRNVHPDVLLFCRAELLGEKYFHAVFEALKSVAAKVQQLSGLKNDGAALVQQAFAFSDTSKPLVSLNSLSTETDKGEQRGFVNLLVGSSEQFEIR